MTKERNVANVPYSRELLNSACHQIFADKGKG